MLTNRRNYIKRSATVFKLKNSINPVLPSCPAYHFNGITDMFILHVTMLDSLL